MSESERRRKYRYSRVLIETARVLGPQFDDAVVFLSGAQIEMLRNVTQYLNRLDTYVSEQFLGYYLAPTPDDYDDILEIVADLEETLMGNPNTIWGYKDRIRQTSWTDEADPGNVFLSLATVPEGEVWVIENAHMYSNSGTISVHTLEAVIADLGVWVLYNESPGVWTPSLWSGRITLNEGDYIRAGFLGCTQDDEISVAATGYSMIVPD